MPFSAPIFRICKHVNFFKITPTLKTAADTRSWIIVVYTGDFFLLNRDCLKCDLHTGIKVTLFVGNFCGLKYKM
jgi:hypothetical protein